ncbi:biliverdin-producing heme oxygenase [Deinococcus malanensis]|uniref:biliverdin-producing heme oxygenase n=1 Tax=Deinococcus malanensis TaxID=1706855 RepID=UPI003630122D
MSRLKHSTLAQHLEVEALMPVLHPGLTLPAYAGLLTQIYAAVQPLEAGLQALTLPEPFELPARLKHPCWSVTCRRSRAPRRLHGRLCGHRVCPRPSACCMCLRGHAGRAGHRTAPEQRAGPDPETGAAYFHAYGARTGTMWKAFTQAMNREVPIEAEERVIGGAQTAFEAFRRVLAGTPA